MPTPLIPDISNVVQGMCEFAKSLEHSREREAGSPCLHKRSRKLYQTSLMIRVVRHHCVRSGRPQT